MTNPYYAGDAGGQPRLLIPSMGQFQDPATQRAMQAILQWANRLTAVTGGGNLLGFGVYEITTTTPTNPLEWSADADPLAILQGDSVTFSPPSDTITLILLGFQAVAELTTTGLAGAVFIEAGPIPAYSPRPEIILTPKTGVALDSLFQDIQLAYTNFGAFDSTVSSSFTIPTNFNNISAIENGELILLVFAHP
jgi:hypothetical protein